MANTRGFEVVAQVDVGVLRQILHDAWKNGGDGSGAGVIPQKRTLPPGLAFGPYAVKDGEIVVPESGLGLDMDPAINGVAVRLGLVAAIEIDDPPIPSAALFNLSVDLTVRAPVEVVEPATKKVGIRLSGLPAGAIGATITSGDPIGPITGAAVAEYVHALYANPGSAFPRRIEDVPISFPPFSMTADLEIFDDESDPARRIRVEGPAAGQVTLVLPCRLRFYDITGSYAGVSLATPMAADANIRFACAYETPTGRVVARISTGTATLEDIVPAPGAEGANYTTNKNLVAVVRGPDGLPDLIAANFAPLAQARLRALGDVEVAVPTVDQIEAFIADQLRQELEARGRIAVWKPEAPEGSDVSIDDVTPKALPDTMAMAINAGPGANANALARLIPPGKDFCVAVSAGKVREAIDAAVQDEFPNGFPHRYEDIEGHDADLNSLSLALRDDDRIRMSGEVTVIDAIVGKIDVDASFEADVDLRWEDIPGGGQRIVPFLKEEPDISMSAWAWIVSIIIGLIVAGIVGVIVVAVVLAVVQSIASRIGGAVIRDEVSNQFKGISAWPQTLDDIGTIDARFDEPVDIDSGGILSSGSMVVTARFALTAVDQADARGPYAGFGGAPIQLNGGPDLAASLPRWLLGDGALTLDRRPTHTYGRSGLFVGKFGVRVAEPGGATTRNFAAVRLANVPAQVTLGPDLALKEGEEFELVAHFEDQEWLDRHHAVFDWGDDSKPSYVGVEETNDPPAARGTARARHAYCTDGTYRITVRVLDGDGGVGEASVTARVENVPPRVLLPESWCVLVGQPVRMSGRFEDPGWCDRHTGEWAFGDCERQAAVIEERHEPPKGTGLAEAVHVYRHCGTYEARLAVRDELVAGEAAMRVHAVELENRRFEEGFHRRERAGQVPVEVANGWQPFSVAYPTLDSAATAARGARFAADPLVERDGRRAQRVEIEGASLAGILQRVCCNRDWSYELEARFNLPEESDAVAMIGIDPAGGDDPLAPSVAWAEFGPGQDWRSAAVRARAEGEAVTCFLGIASRGAGANAIRWDRAHLAMLQPFCHEAACVARTVRFGSLAGRQLDAPVEIEGLRLEPLDAPAVVGSQGDERLVCMRKGGLRLGFPNPVDEAELVLLLPAPASVEVRLYRGEALARQSVESLGAGRRSLVLREPGIDAVALRAEGRGACLAAVTGCFEEATPPPEPRRLCLDFAAADRKFTSAVPFTTRGFTLAPLGRTPLRIVTFGPPQGEPKLAFDEAGLRIALPFPAARATLRLNLLAGRPLTVEAFAGTASVAQVTEPAGPDERSVVVERPGMTALVLKGGGNEASLIEICIEATAARPAAAAPVRREAAPAAPEEAAHGRR